MRLAAAATARGFNKQNLDNEKCHWSQRTGANDKPMRVDESCPELARKFLFRGEKQLQLVFLFNAKLKLLASSLLGCGKTSLLQY